MSNFNESLRSSTVNFGDDFDDLSEVVRLFAPAAEKVLSRRHVHIPGRYGTLIWVVGDADLRRVERGPATDAKGWREITSVVSGEDPGRRPAQGIRSRRRLLFKEESRMGSTWLKFYGVFELDAEGSTPEEGLVFRRVATSVGCVGADVARQPRSAAELAGRMLEAVLLDAVETVSEKPKTVRVWPGDVLRVDGVATSGMLVCTAEGKSSPVAVPVRDVELGYFRLLPADGTSPRSRWFEGVKVATRPPRTSRSKAGESR